MQVRYSVLEKASKSKRNEEEKASGMSLEEKEVDVAVGDILERFEESRKQDNEIAKAEEMRKKSLETLSETKKRNDLVGDEAPAKKNEIQGQKP